MVDRDVPLLHQKFKMVHQLDMEMVPVAIDVENHHGHHRIVESLHNGRSRVLEAYYHDHHGNVEAHHHGHRRSFNEAQHHGHHRIISEAQNHAHHGSISEAQHLGHHRNNSEAHHHGHNHKIVPVSSTPPKYDISDLWKSEEEKKEEEEEKKEISLAERFGYEEIFSVKVWRSSFAELLGTATLTFMTDAITISSSKVETEARILIPSTTIPIIVTFLVLATIPVTGGHINPIVSMSFGLMGRIPLCRAVIYILAQCIGGILGALALKSVADSETERTSSLGGCTVAKVTMGPDGPFTSGLDTSRAFYLEVICSFVFLFISRWIAFDAKKADMVSRVIYCFGIGIGVGFNAFVSRTVTGASGYSGVGVNPATCFGPAIVRGGQLWDRHWIFWIGPIIASIGFYSYTRIIVVDDARIKENKHDFLNILKACYKAI